MKVKQIDLSNWKLKLGDDLLSKEDIDKLPEVLKNKVNEYEVERKMELQGCVYFEPVNLYEEVEVEQSKVKFENPIEQVIVQSKLDNNDQMSLPVRILVNIFIFIARQLLNILSLPFYFLAFLLSFSSWIITLFFGILATGGVIGFFFINHDFSFSVIFSIVVCTAIAIFAERLPIWLALISQLIRNCKDYINYK